MSYVAWLSAEELHYNSKNWLSKLRFAKDEQRFLDNLIKDYTLDLIDSTIFSKVKPIITSLGKIEEEFQPLLKRVNLHERQLQIMVDDVDQFKMEEAYVQTHMDLTVEVNSYFEKYQAIKAKVFDMIGSIIKKRKRKKLLNP